MSAQFTPGPWSVESPMGFELTIVEANKPTYEWRFLASIPVPDEDEAEDPEYPRAEAEANAKLIAASPDLYEALRAITETRWDEGAADACIVRIKTIAQLALRKARGEPKPNQHTGVLYDGSD